PADLKDHVIDIESSYANVNEACAAAKKAFRKWSHTSLGERKDHLLKLKKAFQDRADEMARLISREVGKPLWEAKTEAAALASKIDITLEHSQKLVNE